MTRKAEAELRLLADRIAREETARRLAMAELSRLAREGR